MNVYGKRVAVAAALAAVLLTTGCVENDTMPSFMESTPGKATITTVVTGADVSPQTLTEYGVFYSTSRDDIVAVNGVPYTNNLLSDEDFTVRDGVRRISVPANVQVGARESGTLEVDVPDLKPNTTYYFRFYTVGYDESDSLWKFALKVAEYRTVSTDATLKLLKPSAGKLSPKFSKAETKYSVTLKAKTKKATIKAASSVGGSEVQMRVGSGKWRTAKSATVSLKRGASRKVYVKVTATDRETVKKYTVKVSRKK